MKTFFSLLLSVGIFGSIASVLTDGSSLGKYVRYISALVCVVIIINPLSDILRIFFRFAENEYTFQTEREEIQVQDALKEKAISLTEKQISKKIEKNFGIIPLGVCIEIDREGKVKAKATLKKEDENMKEEIDKFLKDLCEE